VQHGVRPNDVTWKFQTHEQVKCRPLNNVSLSLLSPKRIIILEWILQKWRVGGFDSSGSRFGAISVFCEHDNEMIKSRRMSWAVHVARMREKRNAYRILVGKPEGKSPLGRTNRRWVDSIKIDLREIGWDGVD
jgi:hypothetical protein